MTELKEFQDEHRKFCDLVLKLMDLKTTQGATSTAALECHYKEFLPQKQTYKEAEQRLLNHLSTAGRNQIVCNLSSPPNWKPSSC
jgi:hypothetical protein